METVTLPSLNGQIVCLTVDGSGGDTFGLGAAVSINFLRNSISAYIVEASASQAVHVGGQVEVTATDSAALYTGAIGFGGSGTVGVGAAVSTDDMADTTKAYIQGATVTSGSTLATAASHAVDVVASNTSTIANAAIGGAAAGDAAISGSIDYDRIYNTVDAHVSGGSNVTAPGTIHVAASDEPVMAILSGSVAFGGDGGGAAAVAANYVGDTDRSYIANSTVQSTGGDLDVLSAFQAPSTLPALFPNQSGTAIGGLTDGATYYVILVGTGQYELAASEADAQSGRFLKLKALSSSQTQDLSGSDFDAKADVSNNTITFATDPGFETGDAVIYHDSVVPKSEIEAVAIGGAIAGEVGVAGSASINWLSNDVEAYITGITYSQEVTASGR